MRTLTFLAALIAFLSVVPLARAQDGCTIDTEPVEFGQYDVFGAARTESTGRITIRCLGVGAPTPLRVTLSEGSSGNFQERTLISGANTLRYNLFIDTARRRIAGDGNGGTFALTPRTREAFTRVARFHIYGVVPPRQMATPGIYTDHVRVIIEF